VIAPLRLCTLNSAERGAVKATINAGTIKKIFGENLIFVRDKRTPPSFALAGILRTNF
jgi:hypothetical protein